MKLTYLDTTHRYYLNSIRAKSVTAVAKMAPDSFALDAWHKRQVAIGMMLDPRLAEEVARDPDNKDAIDLIVDRAMATAGAHDARARGSQRHRASELADTGGALLTEQQRIDAEVWVRTIDAYGITILPTYVEQFVVWPKQIVAGRFDRIVAYKGRTVILDLKSGENAVRYPQSTVVQLALYANAPAMSDGIEKDGDRYTVTQWRDIPDDIDRKWGYVILIKDGQDVGELWRLNIEHGLTGAYILLDKVEWRKKYSFGADLAERVDAPVSESEAVSEIRETLKADAVDPIAQAIESASSTNELLEVWRKNKANWTDHYTELARKRRQWLHGRSLRAIGSK